ncbi:hypothetical protein DFH06DRAFT_1349954 [Mycena polygramma]|nr:hypothetical protein DFH06DRAFT_1349954 [Mycena polygramma]
MSTQGALVETLAWDEQLRFLLATDDRRLHRLVFYTMTVERLFQSSLVSPEHHSIVVEFLHFLRYHDAEEDELSDGEYTYLLLRWRLHPALRIMSVTDSRVPARASVPDSAPAVALTFTLPTLHSAAHQAECHFRWPLAARMHPTDVSAAIDDADDREDPAPAVTPFKTDGEGVERLWGAPRARMVDGEFLETLWAESVVWPTARELSPGARHASVSLTQPRPSNARSSRTFPTT